MPRRLGVAYPPSQLIITSAVQREHLDPCGVIVTTPKGRAQLLKQRGERITTARLLALEFGGGLGIAEGGEVAEAVEVNHGFSGKQN